MIWFFCLGCQQRLRFRRHFGELLLRLSRRAGHAHRWPIKIQYRVTWYKILSQSKLCKKTNLIIFFLLIHLSFQFFDLELKINLSLNLKFATRTRNIYNTKQSSLTGVSRRMFSICLIHTHGKHFNILEMKNRSFFMLFLFCEWILN